MFQFEVVNPDTSEHVGWTGASWVLASVFDAQVIVLIGRIIWGLTTTLFVLTGIVLLLERKKWRELDVLASIVSLSGFSLFWNGLVPSPLYYIVGPIVGVLTLIALLILRWPPDSWIFGSEKE